MFLAGIGAILYYGVLYVCPALLVLYALGWVMEFWFDIKGYDPHERYRDHYKGEIYASRILIGFAVAVFFTCIYLAISGIGCVATGTPCLGG